MAAADFLDDDAPPQSQHQRILADIEGRILSGEWPPGMRIPFEHELTVRYACSRMTVNKVMTQLVQAGLIHRRRRAGTFVARPQSQSVMMQIQDIGMEVRALGLVYSFERLHRARRTATAEDRAALGLSGDGDVLQVDCCHEAAGAPFCLEHRLINLAAVPDAAHETFAILAPGAWLVREVPWADAEHTIRARGADEAAAAALGIAKRTPCLVVERRTWRTDAQPVTWVRLTYPGDRHELVARFTQRQS